MLIRPSPKGGQCWSVCPSVYMSVISSSRICLTLTKWPNYGEGTYKNLKNHVLLFGPKNTKAFIHDTLNMSIYMSLHEHAGPIYIEDLFLLLYCVYRVYSVCHLAYKITSFTSNICAQNTWDSQYFYRF